MGGLEDLTRFERAYLRRLPVWAIYDFGRMDYPECETEVYIMKVLVNGDMEEFLPADDDKMEALSEIVEERLASLDEACECECE